MRTGRESVSRPPEHRPCLQQRPAHAAKRSPCVAATSCAPGATSTKAAQWMSRACWIPRASPCSRRGHSGPSERIGPRTPPRSSAHIADSWLILATHRHRSSNGRGRRPSTTPTSAQAEAVASFTFAATCERTVLGSEHTRGARRAAGRKPSFAAILSTSSGILGTRGRAANEGAHRSEGSGQDPDDARNRSYIQRPRRTACSVKAPQRPTGILDLSTSDRRWHDQTQRHDDPHAPSERRTHARFDGRHAASVAELARNRADGFRSIPVRWPTAETAATLAPWH